LLARGVRTTAAAVAELPADIDLRLAAESERLLAMLHDADDRWAQIGYAVEAFVELLINQQGDAWEFLQRCTLSRLAPGIRHEGELAVERRSTEADLARGLAGREAAADQGHGRL
jgi:hypothetical protein